MADTVQGVGPLTAPNTPFNSMAFLVEQAIRQQVCTAIPVRVDAVLPGGRGPVGYLSATPLITQRDGQGKAIVPSSIPKMPYCRLQGGVCAVIIDPIPGDIGIAVFAQQDISTIQAGSGAPVQAGSFRAFDMADGMYIGGLLNNAPVTWIELTQEGVITLHGQKIVLDAPEVYATGRIVSVEDQIAGSISQMHHVHGGVRSGGDTSGEPVSAGRSE